MMDMLALYKALTESLIRDLDKIKKEKDEISKELERFKSISKITDAIETVHRA